MFTADQPVPDLAAQAGRPQPTANAIGAEGINLPSGVRLRREQVARVCATIGAEVESALRRRHAA